MLIRQGQLVEFTFYLSPVLPRTAVYDTDRYMSGGLHTLNAGIASNASSMAVLSGDLLTYLSRWTFRTR